MKIQKSAKLHLSMFTPAQYKNSSEAEKATSERVITNMSAKMSGTDVEILPAIPASSKMIFLVYHTLVRKVVLQSTKVLEDTHKKLKCPAHLNISCHHLEVIHCYVKSFGIDLIHIKKSPKLLYCTRCTILLLQNSCEIEDIFPSTQIFKDVLKKDITSIFLVS